MANLNKVLLIGRLGQDPEKNVTATGVSLVRVSLATNEFFTDKSGEKREKTEWHNLIFWNKLSDLVSEYCQKGSLIYVEGSLRNNEWQDKNGAKRITTEINVRNLQFLDSRQKKDFQDQPSTQTTSDFNNNQSSKTNEDDFLEDDIPF